MPVTLDSTVAGSAANSYVSVSEMTAFVNNRIQGATEIAWVALAVDDQKRYLIAARQQLDKAHRWLGGRVTDLTSTVPAQALEFPRVSLITRSGIDNLSGTYSIDLRVKRAQMFQTMHLVDLGVVQNVPNPQGGSVRAKLQADGVSSIGIGNTNESYNSIVGYSRFAVLCAEAEAEIQKLVRKSSPL